VTDAGMVNDSNPEAQNAYLSIVFREFGNVIDSRLEHERKQSSGIDFIPSGSVTDLRPVQLSKREEPND